MKTHHVEGFFLAILTEHKSRDGVTRPAISPGTYNYYRARLNQLATFAQTRGMLRADVMADVRPMKRERRIRQQATSVVMWAMLDNTRDPRDRALLAVAMNTGLRANEIARLRIADVDLESLTLRVTISKTREEDDLSITGDLATELISWLDHYRRRQVQELDRIAQPTDYLFPARGGPRYSWRVGEGGAKERHHLPKAIDSLRPVQNLHLIAQQALRSVGLPTKHEGVHTLRRSVARCLFDQLVTESGHDGAIRIVSAFLHHSNSQTTELYLGLSSERRTRDAHLRGRSLLGPRPGSQSAQVSPIRG